jgi:predicted AlkP superfamily phosphohydrolase/phosphomutase
MEAGTYIPLGTANPPQSPVAWSTFMTGASSDYHGIYDFVHRDPADMSPYLSTSRVKEVDGLFGKSGEMELLRRGKAFWEVLEANGVPVTVVKIPANFPPEKYQGSEVLAGMGTPDLLGTPGTFQVLTNTKKWIDGGDPSGGFIRALEGADGVYRGSLAGPPGAAGPMTMPVEIAVDEKRPVAMVRMGDSQALLKEGEWSHWIPIAFEPGLVTGGVPGMVRLYLKSIRPEVFVYASPINLDPFDSFMPISEPASYAEGLAKDVGRFYTQNMPEDTKALAAGVLNDDEFLAQADIVFGERKKLLERELKRFNGGVLFFYFSSIDQVSHMLFRALAPDANEHDRKYAHVIPELYERIDAVVGDVRDRYGKDATILIMSDHGFSHYSKKVYLNSWLAQEGYLSLRSEGRGEGALGHIDWAKTQAYALGLNQLFINLRGRELEGAVAAEERELVLDRLERDLKDFRDPDTGEKVVSRVFRIDDRTYPDRKPDVIVGYSAGYRSSDESAMGVVGDVLVEKNRDKWSGDHCMDPRHVPGVLLSPQELNTGDGASLLDLAPTILKYFGIDKPDYMEGRSLLPEG